MYSCKGCDKRFPGCHDECEEFQNERRLHEAWKQKVKDAKQKEGDYYGYQINKKERIRRRDFDRNQKRGRENNSKGTRRGE